VGAACIISVELKDELVGEDLYAAIRLFRTRFGAAWVTKPLSSGGARLRDIDPTNDKEWEKFDTS
jgi:hypothetical protein